MKTATAFEASIWRLRENGLTYTEIASRVKCTKGVVAGAIHRIRHGAIALPVIASSRATGCRWVHGEPPKPGWDWCDAPVANGGAWCDEHRARVYRPFRP
jgi:hypothetical protein